ncbi:S [Deltacoronavirus HNU1-2]|nr:S [Deltacoronavirus HNU1-2] [Deltacoronavirus HNU1-2]
MQRVVLICLITLSAATRLVDRVFDALTFPNAHQYLRDTRQIQPRWLPSAEEPKSDGEGHFIQNVHRFAFLTNGSSPVDQIIRTTQPLFLRCPQWFGYNGTGDWVLKFNFSEPNYCNDGYNYNGNKVVSHIRLIGEFLASPSVDYVFTLETTSGSTYYLNCSTSQRPVGFDAEMQRNYCYVKTANYSQFIGILPERVADVTFSREGTFYVNGFGMGSFGQLARITVDKGALATFNHSWAYFVDQADVLLNITDSQIQAIVYCDKDLYDHLRCQQSSFSLTDGFYSTAKYTTNQQRKTIFVTLPKPTYTETISIFANISNPPRPDGTISGPALGWWVGTMNVLFNNLQTFCVNSSFFMVNITFKCWAEPHPTKSTDEYDCIGGLQTAEVKLPDWPFAPYYSFSQLCLSSTYQVGYSTFYFHYWNQGTKNRWESKPLFYYTYQTGTQYTYVTKPVTSFTDVSELTLFECVDYNIYGVVGTGIIQPSNISYLSGLYYTSSAGQLLAFKNSTTFQIYTVQPCDPPGQVIVYNNSFIGAITASNQTILNFKSRIETSTFYYHTNASTVQGNCNTAPLQFSSLGICPDGSIMQVNSTVDTLPATTIITSGNITIPLNFTISIQAEYLQIQAQHTVVDCQTYVCNGNAKCLQLLQQYSTACSNIEQSLTMSARLDNAETLSMVQTSTYGYQLSKIDQYDNQYNLTAILPNQDGGRSAIEDLLFDKVVTNGLGTVDQDYKECTKGVSLADLACAQYYSGIMVLPGVVDAEKMAMYTASLTGGMLFGGITAASSIPFSVAVQARLNYVALQTDVLQKNQQILANSFNQAMGNITLAFSSVNDALQQTSEAIQTVANALNKIQDVVNKQGSALHHLTLQLQNNFDAISHSIADIYARLDEVEANQQVDRLITGRLAALNAYVTQVLTQISQLKAQRQLAQEKINECVKSQSDRFGFCGNGSHLFSITQAAPNGILFLHTVLTPTDRVQVNAIAGICVSDSAFVLREPNLAFFQYDGKWLISSRRLFQPRPATVADFVQIQSCEVTFYNTTYDELPQLIPDYVDVNQTVSDILANKTDPSLDLKLDIYNQTVLNLSAEVDELFQRAQNLTLISKQLEHYINNINNTLVDLEWLNRVETYIKWPWWVWLLIVLAIAAFACIVITIFLCTGCCGGCFGCCGGCFGLFSKKKGRNYDQLTPNFKFKEW